MTLAPSARTTPPRKLMLLSRLTSLPRRVIVLPRAAAPMSLIALPRLFWLYISSTIQQSTYQANNTAQKKSREPYTNRLLTKSSILLVRHLYFHLIQIRHRLRLARQHNGMGQRQPHRQGLQMTCQLRNCHISNFPEFKGWPTYIHPGRCKSSHVVTNYKTIEELRSQQDNTLKDIAGLPPTPNQSHPQWPRSNSRTIPLSCTAAKCAPST
ncbi:hypothetical protein F4860DRAFT_485018 [Xylaria cubensis]|nr:hypothetical protein F4860DRAFT_485018 [Xylaria cubensis]